jgi:hypothetical protein
LGHQRGSTIKVSGGGELRGLGNDFVTYSLRARAGVPF